MSSQCTKFFYRFIPKHFQTDKLLLNTQLNKQSLYVISIWDDQQILSQVQQSIKLTPFGNKLLISNCSLNFYMQMSQQNVILRFNTYIIDRLVQIAQGQVFIGHINKKYIEYNQRYFPQFKIKVNFGFGSLILLLQIYIQKSLYELQNYIRQLKQQIRNKRHGSVNKSHVSGHKQKSLLTIKEENSSIFRTNRKNSDEEYLNSKNYQDQVIQDRIRQDDQFIDNIHNPQFQNQISSLHQNRSSYHQNRSLHQENRSSHQENRQSYHEIRSSRHQNRSSHHEIRSSHHHQNKSSHHEHPSSHHENKSSSHLKKSGSFMQPQIQLHQPSYLQINSAFQPFKPIKKQSIQEKDQNLQIINKVQSQQSFSKSSQNLHAPRNYTYGGYRHQILIKSQVSDGSQYSQMIYNNQKQSYSEKAITKFHFRLKKCINIFMILIALVLIYIVLIPDSNYMRGQLQTRSRKKKHKNHH